MTRREGDWRRSKFTLKTLKQTLLFFRDDLVVNRVQSLFGKFTSKTGMAWKALLKNDRVHRQFVCPVRPVWGRGEWSGVTGHGD